MPVSNPGGSTEREYEAVLAYMLYSNSYERMTPLALGSQARRQAVVGFQAEQLAAPACARQGGCQHWLHHRYPPATNALLI